MENEKTFSVSETAIEQIKLQLQKRGTPDSYLRLGIKGGGCSGYTYIIQFEDDPPRDKDKVFSFDSVNVVIDQKSLGGASEWSL